MDKARQGGPRPIVLLGPTAGGKSDLAVGLAERLATRDGRAGEVVGADSMQVYCRMDAGTAKPSPALRQRVAHHLIDIVEPTQRFTVADWLEQADAKVRALDEAGGRAIVVGGTNLYIRAFLQGLFEAPGPDKDFREALSDIDAADLHTRLRQVDVAAAKRIHPNDRKRIVRALEVHHQTGRPISAMQRQWRDGVFAPATVETVQERPDSHACEREGGGGYRYDPILIGLHFEPGEINRRINLRVKAMFYPDKVDPAVARAVCWNGESLPEEVTRLKREECFGEQAREALGYKQVLAYLQGQCTLEDAFERTKVLTRRFAKQQRAWLKRFHGIHWLDAAELSLEERLEEALCCVRRPVSPRRQDRHLKAQKNMDEYR